MRPALLLLAALGIPGCAAQRASSMAFELAASNRALQHELDTHQGWSAEGVSYLDDQGDAMQPPPEPPTPVQAEEEPELATTPEAGPLPADPVATQAEVRPERGRWQTEEPVETWTSAAPLDANAFALMELTRALDEHRQTISLEARLEDKQRHIDHLRADLDRLMIAGAPQAPSGSPAAAQASPRQPAAARAQVDASTAALAETDQALAEAEERAVQAQAALDRQQAELAELQAHRAEQAALLEEREQALVQAQHAQDMALAASQSEALEAEQSLQAELAAQRRLLSATELAYQELLAEHEALADQTDHGRNQERHAQRQQRKDERRERKSSKKSHADQNRAATSTDDQPGDHTAVELARIEAEQATAEATLAAARDQQRDDETQQRQARIEMVRLAELAALSEAEVAELDRANAAMKQEQEALITQRQTLEASRAQLQSSLDTTEQDRTRLEAHVTALQQAEDAPGSVNEARQAEIASLQRELEDLQGKEQDLQRVQTDLAASRSREVALQENLAELETLRARAMEAEGMQTELGQLEEARTVRDTRWESTLSPIRALELVVDRRGDEALVHLPSDALFASGSASLSPAGRDTAQRVGVVLAKHPELRVQVEGHTDSQGATRTNWDLAYARARSTLETLITAGIDPALASAASYGEQRPVANNDTAEGRAANRRIELVLTIVEE